MCGTYVRLQNGLNSILGHRPTMSKVKLGSKVKFGSKWVKGQVWVKVGQRSSLGQSSRMSETLSLERSAPRRFTIAKCKALEAMF